MPQATVLGKTVLGKVVAGGQAGVDQAALRAALEAGLTIGGWCPPGRASEEGTIPFDFPLIETPRECSEFAPEVPRSQRTEWNVRDSDATLILRPRSVTVTQDPGTDWTAAAAHRYRRPVLICDPVTPESRADILEWLGVKRIAILNVGGPSEATVPGIGGQAFRLLVGVFGDHSKQIVS